MRDLLWKALWWLLFPLRLFGYGDDIYTLWTNRDLILSLAVSVFGSGSATVVVASQGYGVVGIGLFAVGGLLFALWLIATGIEWYRRRQAKRRLTAQARGSNSTTIIQHADTVNLGQPQAEQSAAQEEVTRLDNPGPVVVKEESHYVKDARGAPLASGGIAELVYVVPYKPYDTASAIVDEPAATIEIEGPEDAYAVLVSYEVRSTNDRVSRPPPTTSINTRVHVLDKDGRAVRNLNVYTGTSSISEDGSWRHTVSGNSTMLGLPAGIYGLNVLDCVTEYGYRPNAQREYRDMRLLVMPQ